MSKLNITPIARPVTLTLIMEQSLQCEQEVARLATAGYQVKVLENVDSLSSVEELPDIFLINITPEKDQALALTRKIRQFSSHSGVLMVVSGGHAESKTLAFNAGADNCITRPYDFNEILAILASLSRRVMFPTQAMGVKGGRRDGQN
jgi:DNA-binding response OmpR family regulator